MEQKISYPNWPELAKLITAFTFGPLEVKNYKVPLALGGLCIGLGVVEVFFEDFTWMNLISPVCMILIGIANIISGRGIKWISQYSSWEERYDHKSSVNHKILYGIISVLLLVCLYGVIKF